MKIDAAELSYRDCHELLAGMVVPRPIAFVSTVGENGVFNVAPFSFFSPICVQPVLVGFEIASKADGRKKDTLVNIEFSREFVINIVTETLAKAMSRAARQYPADVDEFKEVGLTPAPADLVKAPMVAESPINMECRVVQILEFGEDPRRIRFIIGEVLMVHAKDEFVVDGNIQSHKLRAIARMGGNLYCRTTDVFKLDAIVV